MAEEFSKYLGRFNIKCTYIHSDIDTLERVEILHELRKGTFDVLIGVNLLREGLDLPEVSLVAIIDADKEGFLRSERALTQTAGRTARHINGLVIMYAEKVTHSMQNTIDETNRRRKIQEEFNNLNNITPTPLLKKETNPLIIELNPYKEKKAYNSTQTTLYNSKELNKMIRKTRKEMKNMAKELNFIEAGRLREELHMLEAKLKETKKNEI